MIIIYISYRKCWDFFDFTLWKINSNCVLFVNKMEKTQKINQKVSIFLLINFQNFVWLFSHLFLYYKHIIWQVCTMFYVLNRDVFYNILRHTLILLSNTLRFNSENSGSVFDMSLF